jgi:TorA maturation chaperone TorD
MTERLIIHEARQNVYALLQRLFQDAPDAVLQEWLVEEKPFAGFPVKLDGDASAALEQLDAAVLSVPLAALQADFKQLFVGPGPMKAPPWESVYRNEDHLLFDQHTLQVREFYARHGMEFVRINQVPEDAVAIELEFMRLLTERLAQAIDSGDTGGEQLLLQEQSAFLKEHLLIWVPKFVMLCQRSAATGFYSGLATVLNGFLKWDEQTLLMLQESVVD